jgi:predicted phage baseplate assembly protein
VSNGTKLNACNCCGSALSLTAPFNRPSLSALSYRIGTYSTFLRDMLAQIHSVPIPDGPNQGTRPLAALTTRAADDPAIALLDAWAVVADVLTFYQERIANEGFLRTALERLSVLELARTIGYELAPGVAASAYLAFTADTSPGAPSVVKVFQGTKVQNVPPQGKLPQTFETVEDIKAYPTRNALTPRLTRPQNLALVYDPTGGTLDLYLLGIGASFPPGSFKTFKASQVYPLSIQAIPDPVEAVPINNQVYFAGTTTNLQKGDRLLLVGRNDNNTPTVKTKVVTVRDVQAQANLNQTLVDLREDLAGSPSPPPFKPYEYPFVTINSDLASLSLANVSAVAQGSISESDFGAYITMNNWATEEVTTIANYAIILEPPPFISTPDPKAKLPLPDPGIFAFRTHTGFFGNNAPSYSSLLAPVGQGFPKSNGSFLYPNDWDTNGWQIWKDSMSPPGVVNDYSFADVYLEQAVPGILRDSWIALELPDADPAVYRIGLAIERGIVGFGLSGRATGLKLTTIDGSSPITDANKLSSYLVRNTIAYAQSEQLDLAGLPIADDLHAGDTELMLDGLVLGLAPGQPIALSGSRVAADAPGVTSSEVLILQNILHVGGFTTLQFVNGLAYSYVRKTVTVNANTARATHGETVREVLGSGDASQANQSFALKRPPLTYVSAPTATGAQSTLQVRVNNLAWQEAPSLYGLGAQDQDYIVRIEDDGRTTLTFGDGVTGARLPSGQQNVTATYRTGIGPDGNVDAGSLTLLQARPPGIRSVTNPLAASGAAAPEDLDHARLNAPLRVLTLDRIVSLDDYENFARAFAGIGKAQAVALWSGEKHVVHLTVAGANGEAVDPNSALYTSLLGAISQARDPVQQVLVASFQPLFFDLAAFVLVDQPRYVVADVLAAATAALQSAFSFQSRSFAQAVTAAEAIAIIQSVPGVIAVDLTQLYMVTVPRGVRRFEGLSPVLCSSAARYTGGAILPAQLIMINPAGITLTEMQP